MRKIRSVFVGVASPVNAWLVLGVALLAVAGPPGHASTPNAGAKSGKLKVFILAGQSNMQGAGIIAADKKRNDGKGSLEYLVRDRSTAKRFAHLVDRKGEWTARDDVWIWYFDRVGELSVGFGARAHQIGPELQFGHVIGDHYDEQVLLIKIAWGGKSLAVDFRPPSAGGEVCPFYQQMIEHVRDVLANLKTHFPAYDGKGYELVGFGWHQGWNDRINQAFNDAYETNLAHFIRDVRKEFEIDKLPFVIAETGMSGHEEKHPRALSLMDAQAAVAKRKEFRGNVAFVGTRDYYRPPEESPSRQGYHWNSNAETYFLISEGMGQAMIELIDTKK